MLKYEYKLNIYNKQRDCTEVVNYEVVILILIATYLLLDMILDNSFIIRVVWAFDGH